MQLRLSVELLQLLRLSAGLIAVHSCHSVVAAVISVTYLTSFRTVESHQFVLSLKCISLADRWSLCMCECCYVQLIIQCCTWALYKHTALSPLEHNTLHIQYKQHSLIAETQFSEYVYYVNFSTVFVDLFL